MTEFGFSLLKQFGELNRPVSYSELMANYINEIQLKNGIAELESMGFIKEKPLMTYCINHLGRNHLRNVERLPRYHMANKNGRTTIKRVIQFVWNGVTKNPLMSATIAGIIVVVICKWLKLI